MPADARPERIDSLLFRSVGPVSPVLLRDVVARVSRAVPFACRVAREQDAIPAELIAGRNQADADKMLVELEARVPGAHVALVGLTSHDIGNPIFTHFFGRSRLGGRAALVSLARLTPVFYGMADDAVLTARRATVEVVHELGHVAGLRHCDDPECLMRLAHTVEAIDVRGTRFCTACIARLPHEFHHHDE